MTRKIQFGNGRPGEPRDADCNICENCGRPTHPSLECKSCSEDS